MRHLFYLADEAPIQLRNLIEWPTRYADLGHFLLIYHRHSMANSRTDLQNLISYLVDYSFFPTENDFINANYYYFYKFKSLKSNSPKFYFKIF